MTPSQLEYIESSEFKTVRLSTLYTNVLADALELLGQQAIEAVKDGAEILVLDDSLLSQKTAYAMPILLATSYIHQLLIKEITHEYKYRGL